VVKTVVLAVLAVLLVTAGPAYAQLQGAFPRVRLGFGGQSNSGSGVVAGDPFIARSAVVAWNRRWNTLTLYLVPRPTVTCGTFLRAIGKPGQLIQVYVTNKPRVYVWRPMARPAVAFVTVSSNPKVPEHVSGLKNGAQLTFTRVDSYPGGVWRGIFSVPTRTYGDGKVYGYSGTFAATWCELRR
jgi:hypothetical protein